MTRTWPDDWEARKQGVGCWLCGGQFGTPFHAGAVGDAHLERNAVSRGHTIVIFRDRHAGDFTGLSAAEAAAYWQDVHAVTKMIEQVFAPCHMNFLLLGNLAPHLHVHLVPRYLDDPAPGKPLPWEPKQVEPAEFERQIKLLGEAAKLIAG
jgi:diadenosine tetraphosphate (Ap4A) HIT family hydrolase